MSTLAGTARATKRVLIVDDDAAVVQVLHDALGLFRHDHAYSVEIARDGAEGFAALERAEFDLVLLDMYMPRMTGLELLAKMRERGLRTPVLMLTGNEDNDPRPMRSRGILPRAQAVRSAASRDADLARHLIASSGRLSRFPRAGTAERRPRSASQPVDPVPITPAPAMSHTD
jgi:CheY-like chemotaxis protein